MLKLSRKTAQEKVERQTGNIVAKSDMKSMKQINEELAAKSGYNKQTEDINSSSVCFYGFKTFLVIEFFNFGKTGQQNPVSTYAEQNSYLKNKNNYSAENCRAKIGTVPKNTNSGQNLIFVLYRIQMVRIQKEI